MEEIYLTGLEHISSIFHLKYTEIADLLGLSRKTINDWTKKRANIPYKHLESLSKHFCLPKEYFQKELDEKDIIFLRKERLERLAKD